MNEDIIETFELLLDDLVDESLDDAVEMKRELATFTAKKLAEVTELIGDPDFKEAEQAARDQIFARFIQLARNKARASDERVIGAIKGFSTAVRGWLLAEGF